MKGNLLGSEVVFGQFIDGNGIDSHIQMNVFNDAGDTVEETLFFHNSGRGDTVALTDSSGM